MKNPDVKFLIGSALPRHLCAALVGGQYRLVTFRKACMLVKDVGIVEAYAYCARHKIKLPDPK